MTRILFALAAVGIGCFVAITLGAAANIVLIVAGTGLATLLLALSPAETHAPQRLDETSEVTTSPMPIEDHPAFRAIIAATPDPILIVRSGRVTAANDAARDWLGDYIVGSDVRTAIRHPAAAERLANPRPGSQGGTIALVGLGRLNRRVEMRTIALPDASRFVLLTDRTAIDTAETSRADFVANASHELRTPLAAILGFIETLSDPETGGDETTRQRFLAVMDKEARRMQRLVDDLMSLSRIEASKFRAPTDPIDLAELTAQVVGEIANGQDPRADDIAVDAEPALPLVLGDRAQLSQLLHNIVGNAMKYGRPESPVEIAIARDGHHMVRIRVSDHGEGIASEHLPRLTERFYRVDSARSRAAGGTGLGLSLAKHIVERHRGRIDIASRAGHGTQVTIALPCADDEDRAVPPS
ncbi:PAS domain-containing protein [Sphingorhabdus soli]|uniref:histidine kinase n=1 Tax=Flavisphingopyxis soli TaxID=2601267 RepID=A0A5C6UMF3_9SPHN|nr:ATP-binding protein [Sphingorhabdus soli]TXC74109.1 PAS domain-containing protein [Sphingorhabdus soli]